MLKAAYFECRIYYKGSVAARNDFSQAIKRAPSKMRSTPVQNQKVASLYPEFFLEQIYFSKLSRVWWRWQKIEKANVKRICCYEPAFIFAKTAVNITAKHKTLRKQRPKVRHVVCWKAPNCIRQRSKSGRPSFSIQSIPFPSPRPRPGIARRS